MCPASARLLYPLGVRAPSIQSRFLRAIKTLLKVNAAKSCRSQSLTVANWPLLQMAVDDRHHVSVRYHYNAPLMDASLRHRARQECVALAWRGVGAGKPGLRRKEYVGQIEVLP